MDKATLVAAVLGFLMIPVLSSCGGGSSAGPEVARQRGIDDFQYDKSDVQLGEKGSATEGMIVGGRRSQFEGRRQVAFGGEFDKKTYSARSYQAPKWTGGKSYQTSKYTGSTDGSRFQSSSRFNAQSAREGSQQSGLAGRTVDTGGYDTGGAYAGQGDSVDRVESRYGSERYPSPRIIPYRKYQQMTIEETNRILGRE